MYTDYCSFQDHISRCDCDRTVQTPCPGKCLCGPAKLTDLNQSESKHGPDIEQLKNKVN